MKNFPTSEDDVAKHYISYEKEKRPYVNEDFSFVLVFYMECKLKLTSRAKPIGLTLTDDKS